MLVGQAGNALTEIVTAIKKVAHIVAEITAASREQAAQLAELIAFFKIDGSPRLAAA